MYLCKCDENRFGDWNEYGKVGTPSSCFGPLSEFFAYNTLSSSGIVLQPNHRSVPKFPNTKHIWLDPKPNVIQGDLQNCATISGVEPIRIPGYWIDRKGNDTPLNQPPQPNEKVLYYLHGGGYVTHTANPAYDLTSRIADKLLDCHPSFRRSFAVEYRLTSGRVNPFPTALIDALTGYTYLVDVVGFAPENIIVFGDSAGGNLTLALARYLVEHHNTPGVGSSIPAPPRALVLFSPWTDMGTSHSTPESSNVKNRVTDFLPDPDGEVLLLTRSNICGPHKFPDAANSNPYLSPASLDRSMNVDGREVSFKGFPKTFMVVGDAELSLDEVRTLKSKMIQDLGEGWVGYHESKDAVHDFVLFGPWKAETLLVFEDITKWLADL